MSEIQKDLTEIEPLSDDILEDVAGGATNGGCSCSDCSNSLPPCGCPRLDEPLL